MKLNFTYLLLSYLFFLGIGILAQKKIGNRSSSENRENGWKKLIYFNLIIFLIFFSLQFIPNFSKVIFGIITFAGFIEFFKKTKYFEFLNKLYYTVLFCSLLILFIISSFYVANKVLIELLLLVAVFDGFSQLGGKLVGKTTIALKISPNKTKEGFLVGSLFCYIYSGMICLLGEEELHLFLIFIPLLALSGDLLASLIKRKAKIKDYSSILPYQGGFLDRFDSYIFTVSIYYIYLILTQ